MATGDKIVNGREVMCSKSYAPSGQPRYTRSAECPECGRKVRLTQPEARFFAHNHPAVKG